MKRESRTIAAFISVACVIALIAGFALWNRGRTQTCPLPNGAAMQFFGLSRGMIVPKGSMREGSPADMDGVGWSHPRTPRLPTWKDRVHEWSPSWLRSRLPKSWAPPPPSLTTRSFPIAMRWVISGPFDRENWRISWVDANGVESEGYLDTFKYGGSEAVDLNGSLPPPHSENVVLRVRQYMQGKPLADWPLVAEMPMKNPAVLPLSPAPVMKLPASLTQDGVTVTMHSLTVTPNSRSDTLTKARLTVTSSDGTRWSAYLNVYDARRQGVGSSSTGSQEENNGDLIATSSVCLWSDGPWFTRVLVRPHYSVAPPSDRLLRFKVPLPEASKTSRSFNESGSVAGHSVTLTRVQQDGTGWRIDFRRSDLPRGADFRLVSVTDDLGNDMPIKSRGTSSDGSPDIRNHFVLKPRDSRVPLFLDVALTIDIPVIFDFHVQPEFPPLAP